MGKGKGQTSVKKRTAKEKASSSFKDCAADKREEYPRRSTRKRNIIKCGDSVAEAEPNGRSTPTQPKASTSAAARKSQTVTISKPEVLSRPSIIDHDEVILNVINEGLFPTQEIKFKEFDSAILGIIDVQQYLELSDWEKEKWDNAVGQIISIRNVSNARRTGRNIEVPETTAEKSVQTLNEVGIVNEPGSGRVNRGQEGDQVASASKQLNATKTLVHLDKAHIYSCVFCEKQFPDFSKLESHLSSHTLEHPYLCQRCPAEFQGQMALTRHFTLAHSKIRGHFKCKTCSRSFLHKQSLNSHIRKHTGERPYKCTRRGCQRRFAQLQKRNRHFLKVHVGKRCPCTVCGKKFLTEYELKLHVRIHFRTHVPTTSKCFNCKLCGASFKQKDSLNRHKETFHPNKSSK